MMNPAEFANIARAEADFWWYRGMRKILFGMLDPVAAGRRLERVLEAGCGTGYMARALGERYGWRMFPVDLGWEGLACGRAMGLERLAQCDIAALPFHDAAFDAVVSLDVIVHFPRGQEGRAMRELARALKPGGLLAVRVSALDILRSRHSLFAHERQRFTRGRLTALAREHGIRVLRCTYANALLSPVALVKFRLFEPLTGQPPASGVIPAPGWLDRALYAPLALEALWLGAGGGFPFGQSLVLIGEKSRG
ncbi:MAG: class I SAM-dependent methyltransferase [Acidobacteria bacterium]|nr:class I SAM-dependent methyltransferase [Acidobacteriota bacterium]